MDVLSGLLNALTLNNLVFAFIGAFLGTLVGVLPGVGTVSTMAMLLPFTTYLPPEGMIITLAAIYYGATYGGSTTAILMNVPGEVSAVVTALDGYEMTRQGRPGPALAMAAIVSFMAGIVGCILIAVAGPVVAQWALRFGPAEYLGLSLFTITTLVALSGTSLLKGLIVAAAGLILVSVGAESVGSTIPRLTFGSTQLLLGFDLIPVMIGLFGVGEVLYGLRAMHLKMHAAQVGSLMPTKAELRAGLVAGARATAISFPLGLFPGITPSICSFLSYAVEKRIAKDPSRFGKGAIEGVAAAEAANNAAAMGHIIPLLALGVPAGAGMALLLAAFNSYGIVPGPLLFTQYSAMVWTIIGSFFVANIILLVLNLPLVRYWAKIATVPYPILAPIILVLCVIGAFVVRNSLFDVMVMLMFGLIGLAMRRGNWPMAPLILAYVLGPLIESSARQVIAVSPALLLERPIFWAFMVMAVAAIYGSRRLLIPRADDDS